MTSSKDNDGSRRPGPRSLAGQLGRIPHPPRTEKPRHPKVEKPQTAAPARSGVAKPRPAAPNKPGRPVIARRPATSLPGSPPAAVERRSVAGKLGPLKRGPRR